MKTRLSTIAVIALLIGPALAQAPSPGPIPTPQGTPVTPPPSQAAEAQTDDRLKGFQENQIIDQVDARVAQMKASLRLTEEQNTHWADFHSSIRRLGVSDAKRRYLWGERMGLSERRDGRTTDDRREERVDEIDLLRAEADDMAARAADIRHLADAVAPLYRSLDERQQQRLLRFVHRAIESR